MSDFNRSEAETELATRVSKAQAKVKRTILAALGDTVEIAALTAAVWQEVETAYRAAIQPALENVFVEAVQAQVGAGVGIAWDMVNERAAQWASSYSFELVKEMVDADKRFLQTAISSFYQDGLTLGDLMDKVGRQYSPIRAEMIAITETTRAAVEGDRLYANELRKLGARLRGIVETNQDERVCEVCGPKQDQDVSVAGYPPYHPRCRCNVRYVNEA